MLIFRIPTSRKSFLKGAQKGAQSVCVMAMMILVGILAFPAAMKIANQIYAEDLAACVCDPAGRCDDE